MRITHAVGGSLLGRARLPLVTLIVAICATTALGMGAPVSAHATTSVSSEYDEYKVRIKTLRTYVTEDYFGGDEVYLTSGGNTFWGIHHAEPATVFDFALYDVRQITLYPGDSPTHIALWDNDTGVFSDDDDHLGTLVLDPTAMVPTAVSGTETAWFQEDGANYELTYVIRGVSNDD